MINGKLDKTGFPDGLYRFDARQVLAGSVDDLGRIVQMLAGWIENCFVVRADLSALARAELAAGRTITRTLSSDAPYLAEVALPWGMLDCDDFLMRDEDDLVADPVAAVEHAVHSILPAAFHDVTCFWQLSASAGFSRHLKAHLWYWFDTPVDNVTLRRRLNPYVDTSPFSAVQPHYIVPPGFTGMVDPLPVRTGWLLGATDTVILDDIPEPVTDYLIPSHGGAASGDHVSDLLATLGTIGDGRNRFHVVLRDVCSLYSRAIAARRLARDDESFKDFLRARIDAAPKNPGRDVSRYLSDSYLGDLINSASAKRVREHADHPFQRMLLKSKTI